MVDKEMTYLQGLNIYAWVAVGLVGGLLDRVTGKKWGAKLLKWRLAKDVRMAVPGISEEEIEAVFQEIL